MMRHEGPRPEERASRDEARSAPRGRLGAALALFLVILAAAGFFALAAERSNVAVPARQSTAKRHATAPAPQSNKLFYEGIGTAPPRESEALHADAVSSAYTLELHLTDSREKAESMIATFHEQGIEAYFTPLSRSGRIVYRVRHGIFADETSAQRAQMALKLNQKLGAKVVRLQ